MAHLHFARVAARSGSFTVAARACGVSQPALSTAIAGLEQALGVRLFERSPRGTTLTAAGRSVVPLLEATLNAADTAMSEARRIRRSTSAFRLGVSPLVSPAAVAAAFSAMRRDEPEGRLDLHEANLAQLGARLEQGELDVLIVPRVAQNDGWSRRELYSEPLMFVSADQGDCDSLSPVGLGDVAVGDLVLVVDDCGLTAATRSLVASAGHRLREHPTRAHSYARLIEWAAMGLGGALVPESKLPLGARARPVHERGSPVRLVFEAAWIDANPRAGRIRVLVDRIRDAA